MTSCGTQRSKNFSRAKNVEVSANSACETEQRFACRRPPRNITIFDTGIPFQRRAQAEVSHSLCCLSPLPTSGTSLTKDPLP